MIKQILKYLFITLIGVTLIVVMDSCTAEKEFMVVSVPNNCYMEVIHGIYHENFSNVEILMVSSDSTRIKYWKDWMRDFRETANYNSYFAAESIKAEMCEEWK